MLSCTNNAEGQLVLAELDQMKCWEGIHSDMATVAMLWIVYYSLTSGCIAFYFMESPTTGPEARFVPFFILFERSAKLAIALVKTLIVDKSYGPWVVLISATSVFALLWVYVVAFSPCHHLRIFNVARATVYGLLLWSSLMAFIDMGWDGVEYSVYLRYVGWLVGLAAVVYWYRQNPHDFNGQAKLRDPSEDDSVLPEDLSALQNFDEDTNTEQNQRHQRVWYQTHKDGSRLGWKMTDVFGVLKRFKARFPERGDAILEKKPAQKGEEKASRSANLEGTNAGESAVKGAADSAAKTATGNVINEQVAPAGLHKEQQLSHSLHAGQQARMAELLSQGSTDGCAKAQLVATTQDAQEQLGGMVEQAHASSSVKSGNTVPPLRHSPQPEVSQNSPLNSARNTSSIVSP